jgi:hypothetical protein
MTRRRAVFLIGAIKSWHSSSRATFTLVPPFLSYLSLSMNCSSIVVVLNSSSSLPVAIVVGLFSFQNLEDICIVRILTPNASGMTIRIPNPNSG